MTIAKMGNKITIEGNIATISDIVKIKERLKDVAKGSSITIFLKDAMMLPSSFLGLLLKFVQVDKTDVTLEYAKDEIGSLLEEMNLVSLLRAKKVS